MNEPKRNAGDGQKCCGPATPPQTREYPISDIPPLIQQLAAELAVMIPELAKDGAINNSILFGLKIHEAALKCQQPNVTTCAGAERAMDELMAMKLAAVSTVACGDTHSDIDRSNPYWSAAYDDARQLREDYEVLKHNVEALTDAILAEGKVANLPPNFRANMQNYCSAIKSEVARRFNRQTHGVFQQEQKPGAIPDPMRRCNQTKMVAAELSIIKAMEEVEKLEANPLLTEAVILLGKAKDKVADWVDSKLIKDAIQGKDQQCATHPKI